MKKDFKTNLDTTTSVVNELIKEDAPQKAVQDTDIIYSLRIPKHVKKSFDRLRTETERTIKDLIVEALEEYLEKSKNKTILEKYK